MILMATNDPQIQDLPMTASRFDSPPAFSLFGCARSIEARPDAVTRGLSELHSQPVSYDMRVQWIGAALPPWADPEPEAGNPTRWHLLVVEDETALHEPPVRGLARSDAIWRIALLPENAEDACAPACLDGFHLILRCPKPQLANIAEDLAHFLLREGMIGSDERDLTTGCIGMAEGTRVEGFTRVTPGKGQDAASRLRLSCEGGGDLPLPWMVVGQFICPDEVWRLQDVADAENELAKDVAGPRLLKCLHDAPRTEILVIKPSR
ncbi:hypothetical protein V5F43_10190 [Xanthobacter agilis]|uniref:hypothetical protein n=2 Tax=Xanthobacter agilis TaxID=47492 RepID=UPI0037262A95